MGTDEPSCEDMAESLRKKYRYRQLILSGKLVLPITRAAQLLGPDCLYHLYSLSEADTPRRRGAGFRASKQRRRVKRSKTPI